MIHKTKGFEIRMQKCEMRERYKELRHALPREVREKNDAKICALFLGSITYRYAKILLAYAPLPDEIDIMPIVRQALADGKSVAFPRCSDEKCTMEYHLVTDLSMLECGTYGIREPDASLPVYRSCGGEGSEHPVCIVPGVVFDTDGFRIGYGKGYYDRYLAAFSGVRVGMVYSGFILPRLPRGRFDLSVDVMVTEKGVRAVHAN